MRVDRYGAFVTGGKCVQVERHFFIERARVRVCSPLITDWRGIFVFAWRFLRTNFSDEKKSRQHFAVHIPMRNSSPSLSDRIHTMDEGLVDLNQQHVGNTDPHDSADSFLLPVEASSFSRKRDLNPKHKTANPKKRCSSQDYRVSLQDSYCAAELDFDKENAEQVNRTMSKFDQSQRRSLKNANKLNTPKSPDINVPACPNSEQLSDSLGIASDDAEAHAFINTMKKLAEDRKRARERRNHHFDQLSRKKLRGMAQFFARKLVDESTKLSEQLSSTIANASAVSDKQRASLRQCQTALEVNHEDILGIFSSKPARSNDIESC